MSELQPWLPRLGILPVVNFVPPPAKRKFDKTASGTKVRILVKSIIERRIEEPTPVK